MRVRDATPPSRQNAAAGPASPSTAATTSGGCSAGSAADAGRRQPRATAPVPTTATRTAPGRDVTRPRPLWSTVRAGAASAGRRPTAPGSVRRVRQEEH